MPSIRRLVVLAVGIGVIAATAATGDPRGPEERERASAPPTTDAAMPLLDPETAALVDQVLAGSPKSFDALVTLARTMGFSIAADALRVARRPCRSVVGG